MRTVRDLVATPAPILTCPRIASAGVTPAELSAAVRAAVQAAVDAGDLAVARARRGARSSDPRSRSTATTRPSWRCSWPSRPAGRRARSPRPSPRSCGRPTASPRSTSPGPGFLNITLDAAAQGELARTVVDAGAAYGSSDRSRPGSGSTWSSSRPTRPGRCTSGTSGGPRSATRSRRLLQRTGAEVTREYYFNDAGAQIDRFAGSLLAAAQGRADARGRLRRRVHRRDRRRRSSRPTRRSSTCPTTRRPAVVPARRRGADVRRDPPVARRLRRALRRLLQREGPARQGRARRGPRRG